jgi:hypothetical protein
MLVSKFKFISEYWHIDLFFFFSFFLFLILYVVVRNHNCINETLRFISFKSGDNPHLTSRFCRVELIPTKILRWYYSLLQNLLIHLPSGFCYRAMHQARAWGGVLRVPHWLWDARKISLLLWAILTFQAGFVGLN